MKKFLQILTVMVAIGVGFGSAKGGQNGPYLLPADLDRTVEALPIQIVVDPVLALKDRLTQLETLQAPHPERPALSQALDIIQLSRTIRLTSAQRSLVAGL